MRVLRKRSRLRPLDERECYLRLHGRRSGDVEVVRVLVPEPAEPARDEECLAPARPPAHHGPTAARLGPTDYAPALHLVIAYPRSGGRLTGEQVRRELLRRMEARTGEAA